MAAADVPGVLMDRARLAACRLLFDVLEKGAYTNLQSIRQLEQPDLDSRDRAFASALVYGTISYLPALDWVLQQLSDKPLESLDPWVRTILRLGLWQILHGKSIPIAAAVDESVKLASSLANKGAAAYVNAVLRAYERRKPEIPSKLEAFRYGLPTELFGLLKKWYGPEEARKIALSALEMKPWTSLRVNRLRGMANELMTQWQADGLQVAPGRYLPEALQIQLEGHSIRDLIAWQDGLVSVQDEAAMLVGHVASPAAGDCIIDLCAAPGGKSSHMAEIMRNSGRILAVDSQSHRLDLLGESMTRLGVSIVEPICADARSVFSADWYTHLPNPMQQVGMADLVLADVPCSGLGLLARKPEIRLNMTYDRIQDLLPLQAEILEHATSLVRPGGTLVYSTCTINPQENQLQIDRFLQKTTAGKEFRRCDLTRDLPISLLEQDPQLMDQAADGWIQLLPHLHEVDGFFISKLRRID